MGEHGWCAEGPDHCWDDLCRGQDYGICGRPSDTEVCLGGGPCGDHCDVHEWDDTDEEEPSDG